MEEGAAARLYGPLVSTTARCTPGNIKRLSRGTARSGQATLTLRDFLVKNGEGLPRTLSEHLHTADGLSGKEGSAGMETPRQEPVGCSRSQSLGTEEKEARQARTQAGLAKASEHPQGSPDAGRAPHG